MGTRLLAFIVVGAISTASRAASQVSAFPPPLHGEQLAFDAARGVLVLFGGSATFDGGKSFVDFAETMEWDGVQWRTALPSERSPGSRFGHSLAYDPERRLIVMYGG